jgi:hypothetical protein
MDNRLLAAEYAQTPTVVAMLIFGSAPTFAEPITYTFSGTINNQPEVGSRADPFWATIAAECGSRGTLATSYYTTCSSFVGRQRRGNLPSR